MTSEALILHVTKYADDKLIAEAYTETAGHQSFIVKVSHGGRGGVRHTLFQPLALLELEWSESTRSALLKPRSVRTLLMPHGLSADPVRMALTLFLSEFLRAVLREEPASRSTFSYVAHAVRWLNAAGTRSVANFHIAFLLRLTRLLGIYPSEEEISQLCPAEYLPHVPLLLRMTIANQHLFRFTRAQRAEILRIILLYYQTHQSGFPKLKSVQVLSEMFD